ncbi:MAG: hypothetical protein DSY76_03815 [Bacteroidetes bacterium]|nr:MAG: hypothetical protein DSY76_03815 [Bacteroidota bacterium]
MGDAYKRHTNSIIAEWVLKVTLVFFIASLFFSDTALEFAVRNGGSTTGFMVYLKIALIIAYGVVIAAISQATFKVVGFSSIIVGSLYLIIMKISDEVFMAVNIIDLASEILLIGVSIFYLYRHHRHKKKAKKVVKKRIRKD